MWSPRAARIPAGGSRDSMNVHFAEPAVTPRKWSLSDDVRDPISRAFEVESTGQKLGPHFLEFGQILRRARADRQGQALELEAERRLVEVAIVVVKTTQRRLIGAGTLLHQGFELLLDQRLARQENDAVVASFFLGRRRLFFGRGEQQEHEPGALFECVLQRLQAIERTESLGLIANGVAQSNARVSTLMRNLEASPWLEAPSLVEVKAVRIEDNPASEFSLNVKLTRVKFDADQGGKAAAGGAEKQPAKKG